MVKEKVSSNVYNKFISGLNLMEIKIAYSEAKVEENFSPPAEVEIEENKKYEKLKDGKFVVTHEYLIKGIEEGEKEAGFYINVIYKLTYQSKTPLTKKIFNIFSEISLPLHTWPYFRQFVQEMSGRMGLPALTLDLLKSE
ncbi:protein-export chaperone SecB [candidate division WOR-3 bacterium]|nr:protein-export chaperone SecB [candidate division WOR-3 bacterium]